jgi:hypothetical protein
MQKSITDDPEALAAEIVRRLKSGLVVLERCTGAGKSYLAATLRELIPSCAHVEADKSIGHKDIGYFAGMNIDALRQAVCEALCKSPITIFDGILARDLLEKIGHQGKLFVYVQLNSSVGVPADLDTLDQEEDDPEPFRGGSPLASEVAGYHRRRRPRTNSDVLFIRVAD